MRDSNHDIVDPLTPILMLLFGYITGDVGLVLFPKYCRVCLTSEEFNNYRGISTIIAEDVIIKPNFDCCICINTN